MSLVAPSTNKSGSLAVPLRRAASLAMVAGYVNAIGFTDLGGIFPAAMTGNTTQLGVDAAGGRWQLITMIGCTMLSFFAGGLFSSYMQRRIGKPVVELVLMAILVSTAQIVRHFSPDPLPLELPILADAMAMQGETISRFGGTSLQTIVVTNSLLRFADFIAGRYLYHDLDSRPSLLDVSLPGSAWMAYFIGACLGALANSFLGFALVPAILLLLLTSVDIYFSSQEIAVR